MKRNKIVSIFLAIFMLGTSFVLPLSADALSSSVSAQTITTTWEFGQLSTSASTLGQPSGSSKNFLRTGFIDVSKYSSVTITRNSDTSINSRPYFYKSNKSYAIAFSEGVGANITRTITIPDGAKYMRLHFYYNPALTSAETTITMTGKFAVSASQIDASKTGSLTVYKYEMSDTSSATNKGTGTTNDSSSVPSGATRFSGVRFTIKKVAEVNSTYYTKDGTALPTASQATSMSAIGSSITQTTDVNGVAQFTNLPLGIYYVEESYSPPQVTTPMSPFVVSIPFTNTARDEWLYDASVYPKNLTKYTNIDVQKTDDGAYLLAGAEFTLERKVNGSWESFGESKYTSSSPDNSGGKFTMNNLPVNYDYRLTETKTPTNGYYIANNALSKTEFHIDTNGYISSVTGYAVKVNNTTLRIKNTRPTIEKFIDRSRGASTNLVKTDTTLLRYNDNNDFQYYTVKIRTPHISDMSTLNVFKVTDSIGQTVIEPIVTKIVKGSSATGSTLLDSSAYTYTATTTNTSWNKTYNTTIDFDTSKLEPDTYYWITYKVYIVFPVSNAAKVVYSKSTSSSETGTITLGSNTVRYVRYGYKITKKNENNGILAGASFRVYATKEDAVAKKNSLKMIYWNNINGIFYKTSSGSDGTVTFADCFDMDDAVNGQKDFWIAETEAPTGYNLLAEPIKITVTADTYNSSQFDVVNTKKFVFPLTGGMGIWLFVVIGILFIFVSIVIIKKRYEKHQGGNSI